MWYALLEKYGLPVIEGIFFVETDFLSQIVEVIYENWDDNDDPELIAAIEGSLVDQRMKNVEPPEKEVDDVLRKFISDNLQTIEDEVRSTFGSAREARCVPAPTNSIPHSVTSTSLVKHQSGPLYSMRRKFSSFQTAQYRSSRKGKGKATKPTGSFTRDVILLTGPNDEDFPRQGNRVYLQEKGHVIMAFPFEKDWSEAEVEFKLREAFQDIVPLDLLIDFEIFAVCA